MAPTTTHDSAQQQQQGQQQTQPQPIGAPDLTTVPLAGLDQQQIMNLLRHLPQVFNKVRRFSYHPRADESHTRDASSPVTGRSSRDHAFQP